MWEQFVRVITDIYESYRTFRAVDLAQPTFIALWLGILFMPLIGVDRRDRHSSMMFVMYLAAAGVALIFALPHEFIKGQSTVVEQLAGTMLMMIAAAIRWWFGVGANGYKVGVMRQVKRSEDSSG